MKDQSLTPSQNARGIPSIAKSEEDLAADAPRAISYIQRFGELDDEMAQMLGLTPHIEGGNNA